MVKTSTKKILIIDDEQIIRDGIEEYFNLKGFHVIKAKNGKIGMELYKKEKPDIIITDLVMPEMEGIEFVSILRKIDNAIPIIVMSGHYIGKKYLYTARLLGAVEKIEKPINMEKLNALIIKKL